MQVFPFKYVSRIEQRKPKVRIAALSCRQIHGIDHDHTFAQVITFTTIRTIIALVAHLDLALERIDILTAFLNGDLEQIVYISVPEGFKISSNQNLVCKLLKFLYGLKQPPCRCCAKIHNFLVHRLGFTSSKNDSCLYIRHNGVAYSR